MKFDIQESATAALLNLLHREKSPCTTQVCLLLKYILLSDIEDSETDSGKGRMLTACLSWRVETMASSYMVSPSNIVIYSLRSLFDLSLLICCILVQKPDWPFRFWDKNLKLISGLKPEAFIPVSIFAFPCHECSFPEILSNINLLIWTKSSPMDSLFYLLGALCSCSSKIFTIFSTTSSPASSPKSSPALETDSSSSAYTDTMLGRWEMSTFWKWMNNYVEDVQKNPSKKSFYFFYFRESIWLQYSGLLSGTTWTCKATTQSLAPFSYLWETSHFRLSEGLRNKNICLTATPTKTKTMKKTRNDLWTWEQMSTFQKFLLCWKGNHTI